MNSTSTQTSPTTTAPRRGRRWPWYFLAALLALVALPAGFYQLVMWSAANDTEAAVAETTRLDPDWRIEDIEAKRETLKPGENSALHVARVVAIMGRGNTRTARPEFYEQFDNMETPRELNELQVHLLREAYADLQEALAEARQLKDLPKGRFALKFSADWISTMLPEQQNARRTFELLQHDAWVKAHTGDLDGAVESCRAGMNAARALGDEPFMISLLIRIAGDHMALSALERTLAQGRPSERALAAMQALIEQEVADVEKHWINALRGERGGQRRLMEAIGQGKITVSQLVGGFGSPPNVGNWLADQVPVVITREYPALLRHMNEVVEATKLPLHEQHDKLRELEQKIPRSSILVRLLAPAVQKVDQAHLRDQGFLRAARVAVAAERFRLQHQRWPEALADLTKAGLLADVPTDPYDGAPLRWHRRADGMAAYAVGIDKTDDGGNIHNARAHEKGMDVGFKLWDVPRRRQPAMPPVVKDDGLPP